MEENDHGHIMEYPSMKIYCGVESFKYIIDFMIKDRYQRGEFPSMVNCDKCIEKFLKNN